MKSKKQPKQEKQVISKMAIDEKELKQETIPNPVVVGGLEEIGLKRIQPFEIPQFLLMHPALPRGIEIKANRMVKLVDIDLEENIIINPSKHSLVEEAALYCRRLLMNSDTGGAPLFLKKLVQGAFRFGTSFAILQTNVAGTEVLKLDYQHEIFFGPAKYPGAIQGPNVDWGKIPREDRVNLLGKMKIDPKTKKISKYSQYTKKYPERKEDNFKQLADEYVNTRTHPNLKETSMGQLQPIGREFDQSEVIQLAFDTLGDEPLGISLVQFLHLTIKYLLNMERAGAQTMVNFGFNKWKASTPFKDYNKMREFAQTLATIQTDSVVVLPKDIILENIMPGSTEFDRMHPIFMRLIAIRLGIPLPLLTQSGTDTNKASIEEMRKDMYEDFIADELTIEGVINDAFFKACVIKYPSLSFKEIEELVPTFKFKQPPEDLDAEMDRNLKFSLMIRNFATAAQMMFEIGESTSVTGISKKIDYLIQSSDKLDKKQKTLADKRMRDENGTTGTEKDNGAPVKTDKKAGQPGK